MTPEELEKIEARLKAATPGPWRFESHPPAMILAANDPGCVGTFPMNHGRFTTLRDADADFIAHAPTDIAALLAEVRRLTPTVKVARWEKGAAGWAAYTILRNAKTGRRIRMYGPSAACGSFATFLGNGDYDDRFPTEPEARAHIEAWACGKGWEVRNA